jgi:AraC family transcriptional regulator
VLSDLLDHGHDIRRLALPKSAMPLHCMATSAGYEQRRNEVYSWDGMQRGTVPFLVVQHTLVGEGRLDYAGTQYRLTPGQTMVLSMPHAHRYWLERGGHWQYFWMVLNGREALRLARELIDAAGPVVSPSPAVIDRLAQACLTLIARAEITPGEASAGGGGAPARPPPSAPAPRQNPTCPAPLPASWPISKPTWPSRCRWAGWPPWLK